MFTLSTLIGLSVAQLTQGTIVANLGFSEIAFPKPLFHGDTMYAETVVTDKRESKSRPGEGIVTFAHTARNQHGDIVATAVRKTLVRKAPEPGRSVGPGGGSPRNHAGPAHSKKIQHELADGRSGLVVLPGRSPGAVCEGRRGGRHGDPRPGRRRRRR